MQSDEYENVIKERKNLIKSVIRDFFGEEMKLYDETKSFGRFGNFSLDYMYIPCEYKITIEHEFREFYITIRKKDKSFINLSHIVDYNNKFEKHNIYKAIAFLKKTLNEKIYFYKLEQIEGGRIGRYKEQKDGTYKEVERSSLRKKPRKKI